MNIAIVGCSHWHVPLYLPGFATRQASISAVWDYDENIAGQFAARLGGRVFTSPEAMLGGAAIDAAFVFGRAVDMPLLARPFIERGIAVSLEKPGGCSVADNESLSRQAGLSGAYVSVAFIQRHAGLGRFLLDQFRDSTVAGMHFRFVAGSPERYRRSGCEWMLERRFCGGGALLNLGVHFIDLALALGGGRVVDLHAQCSHRLFNLDIEDYASVQLRLADDVLVSIEAGYAYPDNTDRKRDFRAVVFSADRYIESHDSGCRVSLPDGRVNDVDLPMDTDDYYPVYVHNVLDDIAASRKPVSGLAELQAAMHIIEKAYRRPR